MRRRMILRAASAATLVATPLLLAEPANADVSAPTPVQPPGTAGLATLLNWGLWLVTFAAVVGVFIAAGSMMLASRRGEGSEQAAKLGWVAAGCVAAGGASAIVNVLL